MKNISELEELIKVLKPYLKGRTIIKDKDFKLDLTSYEINSIKWWIQRKDNFELPTVLPISERYNLDFIGWDDPKYNDVIICENSKNFFKY